MMWLSQVVVLAVSLASVQVDDAGAPDDYLVARDALLELRDPAISNGPGALLRQVDPVVVARAALDLIHEKRPDLDSVVKIRSVELDGESVLLVAALGAFGGEPRSPDHLELLLRVVAGDEFGGAHQHAVAGLRRISGDNPLWTRAREQVEEVILRSLHDASGERLESRDDHRTAGLLDLLGRNRLRADEFDALAHEVLGSESAGDATLSSAFGLLIGPDPSLDNIRSVLDEYQGGSIEDLFWSEVSDSLEKSISDCKLYATVQREWQSAGLMDAYDRMLAKRIETRRVTTASTDLLRMIIGFELACSSTESASQAVAGDSHGSLRNYFEVSVASFNHNEALECAPLVSPAERGKASGTRTAETLCYLLKSHD